MKNFLSFLALSLFGSGLTASSAKADSWEDYVEFRDEIKPHTVPEIYARQGKITIVPWTSEDKESLSRDIALVFDQAGGIFRLGASQGRIPLYRLAGQVNSYGGHGALWLSYLGENVVAHELTHVADAEHKIARSEEFRILAEPRIRDVRESMREIGITDLMSKDAASHDDIALRCGLPNAYSAETIQETLAELVRNIVLKKEIDLPSDVTRFVRENVINASPNPDPTIALYREGKFARLDGNSPVALQKLNEAVEKDPKFAEAYIERGLLFGAEQKHELAAGDFSTALELMSEYDWQRHKVFWYRSNQFSALYQYEKALPDLVEANRLKPADESVKRTLQQVETLLEAQKKFKN